MKKLALIACTLMIGLSVSAQPAAGKIFVGGSLSLTFNTDKDKDEGTTSENYSSFEGTLMPLGGYFLSDRFAVGARLGFSHAIRKYPNYAVSDKRSEFEFMIAPYGRYYIISGTGGLFVEAAVNTGIGKIKYYTDDEVSSESNTLSMDAGIMPGAYFYITPKLALEGKFGFLGFSTDVQKDPESDSRNTNSTFGLSLSPASFSFGLTYTL